MRRRIRIAIALVTCLLFLPVTAGARSGDVGLGAIVGEPSGLSGKFWLGSSTALSMATAWSTRDDGRFHLQGDFLWHDFSLFEVERGSLPVYYGVGGRVRFAERDDVVGVRFPLGLSYLFEGRRFDTFFEIAPVLDLAPETEVVVEGGIGMRYYFR